MPTFQKKTVYHSQLVSAGPIVVKILSDITKSRYPKDGRDQYYVSFSYEGREHQYICESRDCEDSLRNLKGKTVCIEATGSRDDARIDVTAASAGSQEPQRQERMREPYHEQSRNEQHTDPRREPVLGQTVGMAINNAVRLVSSTDESKKLDYVLSPEFSRSVFIVASDLIRLSRMLEEGQLAKPAKERGRPERQPEPEPEPEPEDLDRTPDIPFN